MKKDRKEVLLRAAYDILKRSKDTFYIQSAMELEAFYDGANCCGFCLMEDIADELNLEEGYQTEPVPLTVERNL